MDKDKDNLIIEICFLFGNFPVSIILIKKLFSLGILETNLSANFLPFPKIRN